MQDVTSTFRPYYEDGRREPSLACGGCSVVFLSPLLSLITPSFGRFLGLPGRRLQLSAPSAPASLRALFFFFFFILLLFNYSCMSFLPIPPSHPSRTPFLSFFFESIIIFYCLLFNLFPSHPWPYLLKTVPFKTRGKSTEFQKCVPHKMTMDPCSGRKIIYLTF